MGLVERLRKLTFDVGGDKENGFKTYNVGQKATIGVSSACKKEGEHRFSLTVGSAQNQSISRKNRDVILAYLRLVEEPFDNVDTLAGEKDRWRVVRIVFGGQKFLVIFGAQKGENPARVEMFFQLMHVPKQIEITMMTRNELGTQSQQVFCAQTKVSTHAP